MTVRLLSSPYAGGSSSFGTINGNDHNMPYFLNLGDMEDCSTNAINGLAGEVKGFSYEALAQLIG